MSNHKDDKALEEFLQRGSNLSHRYHSGSKTEPPQELDAAIIKAARTAVARPRGPVSRNWYVPLSLAAVMVIGVSIVFRMYEYQGNHHLSEPAQEQLFDSVKTEKDYRQGPTGTRGMETSHPQTIQPAPDKDDAKNETRKEMIPEVQEAMSTEKQEPAPALRMLKKETVVPQASTSVDMPASDELSANKPREAEEGLEEKARATVEPPVSPAPEEMEQGRPAVLGAVDGAGYSASAWLADIRQLWESGNKDEAIARFKDFIAAYPGYPREVIDKQLPSDFDAEKYISGFDKNQVRP